MIRTLRLSIYYQLLMSLRMKQALFFTLVFPIFLFVLFGNLWGQGNPEYVPFVLTGILGMSVATEGIFAIGPALKDYYSSGVLRYFKKLPFNILVHFFGLIASQLLMLLMATALLLLTAALLFGLSLTPLFLARVVLGLAAGIVVFGFIGLSVAFLNVKKSAGPAQKGGLGNLVYYLLVFMSDAFYPIGEMNPVLAHITRWSPMNPVLNLMRGEPVAWAPLVVWTVLGIGLFVYQFRRFTSTR
ncbi:ABC-2 type transport system permease protein [Hymenobacter daecheongensis DSM 21074]|uniref:ABC-2 type transport system permease protein n=1 Tax=Hymenobacter daecheongensis DSM 21074 TaxID=1121955 RepID=A0A1M6IX47_9BACT|nr:ABC transporter permease [Hymenobacter daecheongensis]SHJ39011.1 ABC-2 type transport system permease protein [Hymenobacter daecheongensis DSM 21074]